MREVNLLVLEDCLGFQHWNQVENVYMTDTSDDLENSTKSIEILTLDLSIESRLGKKHGMGQEQP